jgi:hypothetical protein
MNKEPVREYGRGSQVKVYHDSPVQILLDYQNGFWRTKSLNGKIGQLSDLRISYILIDGQWINFDGNPHHWKKVY